MIEQLFLLLGAIATTAVFLAVVTVVMSVVTDIVDRMVERTANWAPKPARVEVIEI